MKMNFGIGALESILTGKCITYSLELTSIRNKWSKGAVNLEDLKCFTITTSSTNSIINIFALRVEVIPNIPDFKLECGKDSHDLTL